MKITSSINHPIFNILIVDDIPVNLQILSDILYDKGYKVREVLNGNLALQVAEKEKPDLILLDIMMPEMDGFEVCRRLRENQKLIDVPIIFISALNDTNDIVRAFNAGAADYITKPFRAEEVKARVATHLKLYQQKKEIQEQSIKFQNLNAEKDKFFSIISHDLRGPFNGFLGLTSILTDGLSNLTQADIHEIAVTMKNSAANIFLLLENLLEWSRLQRGITIVDPGPILLMPMIAESMHYLLDSANNKGIVIKYEIPADMVVHADKFMLASILGNLTSNAVKFTRKGGVVTITAKKEPGNPVEITIMDTGIGMSSKLISDLFRLDVQTNRKGTQGEPSSGLGLLLCKDFIEKHGGRIWVESDIHKGSIFHFTLPCPDEP